MILNECEMAMAKELARELAFINRKKQIKNLVESWKSTFGVVKDAITKLWNHIKDVFSTVAKTQILRDGWHVPIKCKLPQAPYVYNYKLQLARSNL